MGRIFASLVIVYFGQFLKTTSSPNFCATFLESNSYVLILTKTGLGYILGNFSHTHLATMVPSL
jgi:hypothetical protein